MSWNAQERKHLRAGRKPKGICLKHPGRYVLCFWLKFLLFSVFLLNHTVLCSLLSLNRSNIFLKKKIQVLASFMSIFFLTWSIDLSFIKTIFVQFKARENSLLKEKREVEERLAKEKAFLEKENFQIFNDLQKANEQRAEMENKLLQTNSLLEQLKQLQGQLQREKEDALREAEEMRKLYGNSNFISAGAGEVSLTEFSYSDIQEATNNFDESREIGHGGCASVYMGFLRHTTVAIKKFNREGIVGEKEFNDEVIFSNFKCKLICMGGNMCLNL
jgi:hypothetical protein